MDEFFCQARRTGDFVIVSAHGELDVASGPRLLSACRPWMAPGVRIVIDCSGIGFMDSWGLRALLRIRRAAAEAGASVALAAVPKAVSKIFLLAGVDGLFTPYSSSTP